MLFDAHGKPLGEDDYRERLLSMTALLVLAAGGKITVPGQLLKAMDDDNRSIISQTPEPDGGFTITVTEAPIAGSAD